MAVTVLLTFKGGKNHHERGKTYWYSDNRFDLFKEITDWIYSQKYIVIGEVTLRTKYISKIEHFANCMCED